MNKIKNIAIIAHVDHGKTTLIDCILKQTGIFRENEKVDERIMDSNDLEKERGITIFSKNASFSYADYKINIVDTPGHADFGGEVQRIMKMVDSVLLVVDAFEGPMPQTKYVLKKSLELGVKPIVVINKIDRPKARPDEVLDLVFDLFINLGANEDQLDFPIVYASAKEGYAQYESDEPNDDIIPLLETIIENVEDTKGDRNKTLQFLVSAIEYDDYLGKMGIGKISNGKIKIGDEVLLIKRNGDRLLYRISQIFAYEGLSKIKIDEAFAGDIVCIAGLEHIDLGETITDKDNPKPLPIIKIDEPTLSMTFTINNSPFAGTEGKYVTSRKIKERLYKELQTNPSLRIEETENADAVIVKGRGELQLAILIENMRREGYELQVSKPKVIYRELNGKKTEPIEIAVIEVSEEFVGTVIELMGARKGEMIDMVQGNDGYTRLEFKIPSRGLIGLNNQFMTDTRGSATISHSFYEYEYYKGDIKSQSNGRLIALENGTAMGYALNGFQARGVLFIPPTTKVYAGMIVGENSRSNDLVINVCKGKKLTNVRASGNDDALKLAPPREFSLEQAMEYIDDDELLEITPKSIRMRKKYLDHNERKRFDKTK